MLGVIKMKAQSNFCGSITKPVTVSQAIGNDHTPFKFYDRFGNIYTQNELRIYKNPNVLNVRNAYEEGIFILTFQDIETLNGKGFNDPTFGNQRLDVVRQVFRELSDFLQTPSSTTARVRINITASKIFSGSGVLGEGSSIYKVPSQDIGIYKNVIDGEVAHTINGGVDSYIGLDPSIATSDMEHGTLTFYFPSGTDNDLYYDLTNADVPANKFDFYSIVLHEVFHCLGFNSLMTQSGNGYYANYTRYDSYLRYSDNGTSPPPVLTYSSLTNLMTFSTNGRTNPLNKGCGTNNGIAFMGQNLLNQAVHTPSTWEGGSSLSHIECEPTCTTSRQNVMLSCIARGPNQVFRHPSQAEASALCDLGYKRNPNNTWGLNPNNSSIRKTYTGCTTQRCAYGVNDRFDTNGAPYQIIGTGSITINNILNNDQKDQGTNLSINHLQIRNGTGTLSNITTDSFTFTPSNGYIGLVLLSYVPACGSNNTIPGNLTYISIIVKPTPCPTVTAPTCGQNLVCFGDFESTRSYELYGDFIPWVQNSPYRQNSNSPDVYERNSSGAYLVYVGTGNVSKNSCNTTYPYPLPNGTNNNRYLGIGGSPTNREAANFPLKSLLDPSKTYRLTFDATARSWYDFIDCNASSVLRILGADKAPCTPPEKTSITPGTTADCGFTPKWIRDVPINTTTNWTTYTVDNINGQAISQLLFTVESPTYIFIDNVKLELIDCPVPCQPAGFTAVGTDVNSVTNVSTLVNLGILPSDPWESNQQQLYVQGTLVMDIMDYQFINDRFKMAPGSRILINSGAQLFIWNTIMDGCDNMWQGIHFQSGTVPWGMPSLLVFSSTIQDAEIAIAVQRTNNAGAGIYLYDSKFLDNYYNLFIPAKNGSTSEINSYSFVQNCMFANPRGNLKPSFLGQSNWGIKTGSGISVTEVPSLTISNCSFMQMDVGISAFAANLTVTNTSFKDMPYRQLGWFGYTGIGIAMTNGTLNYTGFGRDGMSAINNAYIGISLQSSKFNIQDCNMTNCGVGVSAYYSQVNSGGNNINNNRIQAYETGITLAINGNSSINIDGNFISPASNNLNKGINIYEYSPSNAYYYVNNNDITLRSIGTSWDGATGIALNYVGQSNSNFTSADVSNNKIFVDNRSAQSFATGIQTNYSANCTILYNQINGTAINNSTGIGAYNNVNTDYKCNGIDNVQYGMSFGGNNMMDQSLQSNHFLHIKQTGLLLSSDAIIGQQLNTGNVWEFGGYSDFAAKYLGSNATASLITTNSAPQFFAQNNILPQTGWFQQSSNTAPDYCNSYFSTPVLQVRGAEPTEEEIVNNENSSYRTVAEGKNKNQSEATQNLANRQLMGFLDAQSRSNRISLNSSFGVFKTKVQSKLEKKQYNWDRDIDAALTMDTIVIAKLKENVKLQQEALKNATVSAQRMMEMANRDKLAAAKTIVNDNTLARLMKEQKDIEVEHSKKIDKIKTKLRTDNKDNKGQKLHEQHESYVNDAFLDLTDGKKPDRAQVDQLDAIANLCPSLGGVAVYKARSILGSLAVYIGKRSWNDWKNCSETALNSRGNEADAKIETTITPQVLVFPNPTNGILKLSFYDTNASSEAPHTIQIFNTTGRVLKHVEIARLKDTDIDTQGLASGVYILKITAKDGEWSKSIKISILH